MTVFALGYFLLLAAFAGERVFELWLSTRNARRALAAGGVEKGRGHYPVMAWLHTAFFFACVGEWVWRRPGFPGAVGWVALGGCVLSQALRYWAVVTLGERWSTRVIVRPGLPPVVAGPYRFVRHPNYVAVVMELAFLPLVAGLWVTAIAFSLANAALLRVRIRAEEDALGASYAAAFAGTPRFVPGRSARGETEAARHG